MNKKFSDGDAKPIHQDKAPPLQPAVGTASLLSKIHRALAAKVNSGLPHEHILLTRKELCAYLGTTESWAEYQAWAGDGPPITRLAKRRSVRYRLSDVLAWLNNN